MPRKHIHHWKLEPPGKPTSLGKCRCGATREFSNIPEDLMDPKARFVNPVAQTGDRKR